MNEPKAMIPKIPIVNVNTIKNVTTRLRFFGFLICLNNKVKPVIPKTPAAAIAAISNP